MWIASCVVLIATESILDQVAPVKSNLVSHKAVCPWINDGIRDMKRLCRKTERLWKSTKLEVHRLHLRELMSSLNETIKNARSDYFRQLITMNKKKPQVLFDTINSVVCPAVPPAPVFCKADSNKFRSFFIDKIQDIKAQLPTLLYCTPDAVQLVPHEWSSFSPVTRANVSALITRMKPSCCVSDVLPCKLFVKVFDVIGPWVINLINLSLCTGVFPSSLKHAIIEPLLKKSRLDPMNLNNFRPISKLLFLSKVLEKVVADQLLPFLEKHNIFDTFQSGFRKHHSTETTLLKVSSDIMMSADSGRYTVLVLLDLSSAFDTVNHQILLTRLRDLVGMSGPVLAWFSSYLLGRSFTVSANKFLSDSTDLLCGVLRAFFGPDFVLNLCPSIRENYPEL